ncbi:hypothetical protein Leryth_014848, partial [Lithospermum erythrorhizon]
MSRKTACRSSSYRNRFYALVDSCRLFRRKSSGGRSRILFYICVSHVRVIGHPLFPAFDLEILEPSGNVLLKYYPEALRQTLQKTSDSESAHGANFLELVFLWGTDGLAQFEWNYLIQFTLIFNEEEEHM